MRPECDDDGLPRLFLRVAALIMSVMFWLFAAAVLLILGLAWRVFCAPMRLLNRLGAP